MDRSDAMVTWMPGRWTLMTTSSPSRVTAVCTWAMEALASGVYWHTLFWHSLPVTLIFYAACIVHTGLGIWALYERRQFRWKAIEPLQQEPTQDTLDGDRAVGGSRAGGRRGREA